MRGAECIIAINTDRKAPVFDIANIGLVGDWYEILPRLLKTVKGGYVMGYRKLDERDIAYLKKVTEDGRVLTGSDISQDYSHDELGGVERAPEALVRVLSTGEVSDIMAYANREEFPWLPEAPAQGWWGAAVAIHGGIMLETTQMNHILELDRRNLYCDSGTGGAFNGSGAVRGGKRAFLSSGSR